MDPGGGGKEEDWEDGRKARIGSQDERIPQIGQGAAENSSPERVETRNNNSGSSQRPGDSRKRKTPQTPLSVVASYPLVTTCGLHIPLGWLDR